MPHHAAMNIDNTAKYDPCLACMIATITFIIHATASNFPEKFKFLHGDIAYFTTILGPLLSHKSTSHILTSLLNVENLFSSPDLFLFLDKPLRSISTQSIKSVPLYPFSYDVLSKPSGCVNPITTPYLCLPRPVLLRITSPSS